jgi:hypothetical protein
MQRDATFCRKACARHALEQACVLRQLKEKNLHTALQLHLLKKKKKKGEHALGMRWGMHVLR